MPIKPMVVTCFTCGEKFHTFDANKKNCTDECAKYGAYKKHPKNAGIKTVKKKTTKKCPNCNEYFEVQFANHRICFNSQCRQKEYDLRIQKSNEKKKVKNPMPKWKQNIRCQEARLNIMARKLTHSTPNRQY